MNIIIAGIEEESGKCLLKNLAARGDCRIYAVARGEERPEGFSDMDIAWVDPENSPPDEFMDGMDVVFFLKGCEKKTNDHHVNDAVLEETKSLVDAAQQTGVKQFVLLSALGANDPQGENEPYLYRKREAEDYVRNTDLDYTIIRPGELTRGEPTGKVELRKEIEWIQNPEISCQDLASVLAGCIGASHIKNKTAEVLSGDTAVEDALKSFI